MSKSIIITKGCGYIQSIYARRELQLIADRDSEVSAGNYVKSHFSQDAIELISKSKYVGMTMAGKIICIYHPDKPFNDDEKDPDFMYIRNLYEDNATYLGTWQVSSGAWVIGKQTIDEYNLHQLTERCEGIVGDYIIAYFEV